MKDRSGFKGWRRVLRIRRVRRDLDEELAFHRTETVEELMAGGMARDEAEVETRRRFGDPRHRKRLAAIDRAAARRQRWRARVGAISDGARFAIRGIARSPGLSLGIVLVFALGLGVNATMYGTIDRLLLRPPDHIRDPDRVRRLWVDQHDLITKEHELRSTLTYPDYVELRRASSFSAVVAYDNRSLVVGHGETSKEIEGQLVTGDYWTALDVQPALGRFFDESEDVRDGAAVAVISYGAWQREYGGDRSVLGRTIDFGHGPYTIIGVAPSGFTGAELSAVDLWLPLLARTAGDPRQIIAAVRRVTVEADARVRFADVRAFQDLIDPQLRSWTLGATLFSVFGLLALVVAAVGLYSVLSFDVAQRTREIGLRSALGASPASVVRLVIVRALWLTAAGTTVGVLAAVVLATRIEHLLFETAPRDPATFAGVVLALTVVAIIAATLPAWRATRVDPNVALHAD